MPTNWCGSHLNGNVPAAVNLRQAVTPKSTRNRPVVDTALWAAGIWNSTTSPTAIVAEVGENAVNDGAVKVATGVLPAQATVMTVAGAASMGVPVVGLGYNPKFAGLFGQLGIEPRLIELDAFAEASQAERLVGLMRAAIEARDDLRAASLRLADQARTDVVRFLHPDSAAAGAMS